MIGCLPGVTVPTFFVHYAGDIFVRMADLRQMMASAGAPDVSSTVIPRADHYGREIKDDGSLGARVTRGTAAARDWLLERFTP
jgi:hypothetical protein